MIALLAFYLFATITIASAVLLTAGLMFLLASRLNLPPLIAYLLALNTTTLLAYAYDKGIAGGDRQRVPERVLHGLAFFGGTPAALVGQRVYGIALGYEDLIDHDQLRHDPVLAALSGKLMARRSRCAALAGKSTLNRLELGRAEPSRYHKIGHDGAAIERLFVDLFVEAHAMAPDQIILDLDATDDPVHGEPHHHPGRYRRRRVPQHRVRRRHRRDPGLRRRERPAGDAHDREDQQRSDQDPRPPRGQRRMPGSADDLHGRPADRD